jgi:nucleoside phosphorylase/GTPase SAR1 family protein
MLLDKRELISDYKNEVHKLINDFNRQQSEYLTFISIIRVLPLLNKWVSSLGVNSRIDTSTFNTFQKILFSIFHTIDVIIAYADNEKRTSYECEVAYNARCEIDEIINVDRNNDFDPSTFYVIYAIANAIRDSNLFKRGPCGSYATTIAYICKAVELYDRNLIKNFKDVIFQDIKAIKSQSPIELIYNKDFFQKERKYLLHNLRIAGCDYWSEIYEDLYINNFRINKNELVRRLRVPDEIKDKGAAEVGQYLMRLGDDFKQLNEARIIILGEKGAGKTSIARRLVDINANMPEEYESTEGVTTSIWSFPDNNGENMNVHIWDFAGHSITHSAHRCFMSARCLYIYVYNGRVERDNDPMYWLEQIRIHGGESKILFLINEKDNHRADIAEKTLKRDYSSIIGYYRIDIGNDDKTELIKFRKTVMKMVRNEPLWNNQVVSIEAYKIKNYLRMFFEKTKAPHITREEFDEIALKNDAPNEHISGILDDLHSLGICFWYKKDNLEDFNTLVLNPNWITNAIYKIINVGFKSNKQKLTVSDGVNILRNDENYKYPRDKIAYIFYLMREYELAYFKSKKCIFIPGILPIDEPDDLPTFNLNERLTMSFSVDKFLPPNICTRIIVHRSEYGEIFDENLLWRKGGVLKSIKYDAIALIIEDGQSITVRVKGEGKTDFLISLRETLHIIFESYKVLYPNLLYEVLEPTINDKNLSNLIERETPLMLDEEKIKEYLRKDLRYLDATSRRFIPLDLTGVKYHIPVKKDIYFLFVTANDNERLSFERYFEFQGINFIKGIPYSYGKFGIYSSAWFHMPSQGTSNADATILCGDIIKDVAPVAVIMVGIAFGTDEKNQKIGDVLVSRLILNYDSRKKRGGLSQYKESPKEVGFHLLNAFRSFNYSPLKWEYPLEANEDERYKIIEGAMLTGSVLIDDYNFRQDLLKEFSVFEPIGGEMEGYGIYSQCRLNSITEWIIVKAICDWGYNKQNAQKDKWQKIAAESAVNFCHCVFSLRGGNGKGIFDDLINI